ncbi:hypothetical protein SK128_025941 [Halocaridina rubra]|uniref:Thioredoxin domain-containing protein n=1 Tax=Halocaridina rubra TaxID=373956 RepID=A0AAN9A1U3_HALRR
MKIPNGHQGIVLLTPNIFLEEIDDMSTDKRSCKDCDKVLSELETIDDDTDRFGVHFVKVADKKLAKSYGVKIFPALSFFRNKEPIHYEGDLMDEASVLEFLTSLEAMELPDQIEEVNAKILDKIVEEQEFVAVLFCKYIKASSSDLRGVVFMICVFHLFPTLQCLLSFFMGGGTSVPPPSSSPTSNKSSRNKPTRRDWDFLPLVFSLHEVKVCIHSTTSLIKGNMAFVYRLRDIFYLQSVSFLTALCCLL